MLLSPPSTRPLASSVRHAFTLVEMLAVIGIIVVLLGIAVPVVTSFKSASDVTTAAYNIAGVLEQSRAYAMANNTYVYVGLNEFDVSRASSGKQVSGIGRVIAVAVATKDGTQGFSASSLQSWSTAYPALMSDLNVVGKPLVIDNLHVPDLGTPPATGGMARPALTSSSSGMSYSFGNASCISATPYDYPVGATLGSGQYSFTKVIQFDPQGIARIQNASNPAAITPYMEVGLQQSRGTTVSALPTSPTSGNIAAIQIDGITGAVRIYRP